MSTKEWLNERPGLKWEEEEAARKGFIATKPIQESEEDEPFNPFTDVSADAKYIVHRLIVWFFIVPLLLGILLWLITR